MKITSIIVDEQNRQYSVKLEGGEEFKGVEAFGQIMLRKSILNPDREEPYIDSWGRKYLRKIAAAKKLSGTRKFNSR